MKKLLVLLLALVMIVGMIACDHDQHAVDSPTEPPVTDAPIMEPPPVEAPSNEPTVNGEPVIMTYAEFLAAPLDTQVTVDTCIQDVEEWWDGKLNLYTQNDEGAYYIYGLACTEEEAWGVLNPGAKIRVTGYKSEWAGEIEIIDATYELLETVNDANFVECTDVTDLALQGNDALIEKMNHWVFFKGLTVIPSIDAEGNEVPFLYKWDGSGTQGDDIYFNVAIGEQTYTFTVNAYMVGTGPQSEVYEDIIETLEIGDVITVEGYLYWYNGAQPHVTAVYPTD